MILADIYFLMQSVIDYTFGIGGGTMVTIEDVAREAGVSVATVSRVINRNGPVSAKSEEKVNLAIARLNYRPNVWGRRLRRQESRMILIFVPYISNPFYASIVSGVEDTLRKQGYGTMLCITNGDKTREQEFIKQLYDGQADGAVIMCVDKHDKDIEQLAKEVPVVQCCEYSMNEDISHVSVNNFAAANQVVKYLGSLGHERIGFVGSINQFISSNDRQSGYEEGVKELAIPLNSKYIAYGDEDYSFNSGVRAGLELLSLKDRPTAIFCISDVLALGVVRAARNLGLLVPRDVSVVGFDDVEYATMLSPMLTTVSQPRYSLGKTSAQMLIHQIESGAAGSSIYLEHKLILRESTAGLTVR